MITGEGPIYLSDIVCNPQSDKRLLDCLDSPGSTTLSRLGLTTCNHMEDVVVHCEGVCGHVRSLCVMCTFCMYIRTPFCQKFDKQVSSRKKVNGGVSRVGPTGSNGNEVQNS